MTKYVITDFWGQKKSFQTMEQLNAFLRKDGMSTKPLTKNDFEQFNKNNELKIETKGAKQ